MEAQYYVPKISEFHFGFEYEFKSDNNCGYHSKHDCKEWTSQVFSAGSCSEENSEIECIEMAINKQDCDVRVKCLDEQDIIDLGWHDNLMHDKDGFLFCIEQIENKVLITQIGTAALKQDIALYFGNIKNKSELKRIMQMLKIIE
jgi:hypothetical protein